jgi:hypothetical protein
VFVLQRILQTLNTFRLHHEIAGFRQAYIPLTIASHSFNALALVAFKSASSSRRESVFISRGRCVKNSWSAVLQALSVEKHRARSHRSGEGGIPPRAHFLFRHLILAPTLLVLLDLQQYHNTDPAMAHAKTKLAVSSLLRSSTSRLASGAPLHVRCLATPASAKSSFGTKLDEGPSFDDFVADNVPEKVVLGNTSQ